MTDRHSDQSKLNNNPSPIDLDWLAFCYVADELDLAQRAEFEIRLENDELAQQAVVDAVQQTQLLYASLNSTSFNDVVEPVELATGQFSNRISANPKPIKRAGILCAATATLLVFVAGLVWWSTPDAGNNGLVISDSDRLASAWVETLVVMNNEELDQYIEEETPIADFADDEGDNWMLVALTDLENAEGAESETN